MRKLRVFPDPAALADTAATYIVERAQRAVAARGRFNVALAGGSTPRPTYRCLLHPPWFATIPWSHVHLFWGDERCVPPDHDASNYRMVREVLLESAPIPKANIHRIPGELPPKDAASHYRWELETALGPELRFDLILLGMGVDGHTASLFPGSEALDEEDRTVVAVHAADLDVPERVTLTLPLINAARDVLFLVTGSAKARTLARVWANVPLPAARVQPKDGALQWFVDRDAAARLPQSVLR